MFQPYQYKEGDIIVYRARGNDWIQKLIEDPTRGILMQSIAGGQLKIVGGKIQDDRERRFNGSIRETLLKWARLAGRHIWEVACQNPAAPNEIPTQWLRIKNIHKPEMCAQPEALPTEIQENWGKATAEEISQLIREYVIDRYDCSNFCPIDPIRQADTIDQMVAEQLQKFRPGTQPAI